MRFLNILALAAGATAGLVTRTEKCLKQDNVDYIVDAYRSILTHWEPAKAGFIADVGFFDYSDSINTVAGLPTGFPIFPNKAAFVAYQTATVSSTPRPWCCVSRTNVAQPDNLPVVIVEVGPWNCNQITIIWSATFTKVPGGEALPVRGIAVVETSYNKGEKEFEIQNIKVEFNSINYYKNTGGVCSRPAAV
jgi:hypothetical protein